MKLEALEPLLLGHFKVIIQLKEDMADIKKQRLINI